jgi:hypothetical protein
MPRESFATQRIRGASPACVLLLACRQRRLRGDELRGRFLAVGAAFHHAIIV